MSIDTKRVRSLVESFQFKNLFIEELGWGGCNNPAITTTVADASFSMLPFAQQGGMVIYLCESDDNAVPDLPCRRALDVYIAKISHEHMIIFTDKSKTKSVWQWAKREAGKSVIIREHTYHKGQPGDSLLQKLAGIAFSLDDLDEEGKMAITDVTRKVAKAFDLEKVTKRFFDEYQKEHNAFSTFLKGIDNKDEAAWYVSVMLNRLMFIYFIQKKGFLDGDMDYLRHKLEQSKARKPDQFYRGFLIRLFFEGFAREERPAETESLLGKIPYLNGGLFLPHQLELTYGDKITIADAAFDRIFAFFERYNWHLDYRPLQNDNEINPDVLGYIFEKYVNQKQMGAYYTKEDITDYISKNTIIPFLFDKLESLQYNELHPFPISDIEPYIYESVRQVDYLPTETEREYSARQKRYQQIKGDFTAGKIATINDLLTYNLDIRKFAYGWARGIKNPLTLRAFYFECLTKVTILDPTVGSGAFLFAALNILEPLYEICLDKMKELGGVKYPDFAAELGRIAQHPNRTYYVFKSIIINNLYGVDIMEEATEICKLRLFLKLVSQVEDVRKLEPLPDIDFNIRAGNSLVGYATIDEIQKVTHLDLDGAMKGIVAKIQAADRSLANFRELQTRFGIHAAVLSKAKGEVKEKLGEIQKELDRDLASFYGARNILQFVKSHQPFHWFVEFYRIMNNGGFNVIIGNPPYVEYAKVKSTYAIQGYKTESCGNLYAFLMEKAVHILSKTGWLGFITPLSAFSTERMMPLQNSLKDGLDILYLSHFSGDRNPAELFTGVKNRLTIALGRRGVSNPIKIFSANYLKWYTIARFVLFSKLEYMDVSTFIAKTTIPKMGQSIEKTVIEKINRDSKSLMSYFSSVGKYEVIYHNTPIHWTRAFTFRPFFWNEREGGKLSTQMVNVLVKYEVYQKVIVAILNSTLFFWFWLIHSDCYHLTSRELLGFKIEIDKLASGHAQQLINLCDDLMGDFQKKSIEKQATYRSTGLVKYQEIDPKKSKHIIDEIDRVLAHHYGFTEEELDFIINYDIKYRMGKDNEEENDS